MPRTRTVRPLTTAALAAVALALALAACSGSTKGSRNSAGDIVKAGTWSVFDLRRGDCLAPPADAVGEADTIKVVPCSTPHTQEVFASVAHTADAFPGVATLQRFADAECATQLGTALGVTAKDGYFVSYLLPSFDSWTKRSDKSVTCVLVFPSEPNKTGSIVKDAAKAGKGEVGASTTTAAKGAKPALTTPAKPTVTVPAATATTAAKG